MACAGCSILAALGRLQAELNAEGHQVTQVLVTRIGGAYVIEKELAIGPGRVRVAMPALAWKEHTHE